MVHKVPGHILFVNDNRFYDQTAEFTAALDNMDLTYDRWDTGHAGAVRNGPSLALLQNYDFVIWYTGYDSLPAHHPGRKPGADGLPGPGRPFVPHQPGFSLLPLPV